MNACSCCPQLAVVSQWGKETGEGGTGCIYSSEWTPGLWKNWTLEGKGLIIYSGRFLDTEASRNSSVVEWVLLLSLIHKCCQMK